MSRRTVPPLVLRDYQQEAVERLSAAALDTVSKMRAAAPDLRRRIARRNGCSLLEAPTGSGKTVMLAATAEAVSRGAPVVWFWFAPFAGLVAQTAAALREAAPALRVRDPVVDRADVGTRPGDVFVATWAGVAARNVVTRRMRTDDDVAPALDTLIARLRLAGFVIGAVVDEAHHSFRPGTEAFRFFDTVLDPDLLMCATATPNDADVELVRRALNIGRFQRVAVSRSKVVAARLNKPRVRAVSFVARGASQQLLDLNEVALRKAVEQHKALKAELRKANIPVVPLLLVQAASTAWTPARVRDFLLGPMKFANEAVAVHTADEPDPNVQALANDPNVEVLVFKMAVATGFDAPRAFTLCALRPVADASFGLQVIGRIMRVHSLLQRRTDLPAVLDTGFVFLGDAGSQAGLQSAADRIRAMRDAIEVLTDGVAVYEAAAGEGGQITVTDEAGQSLLVFSEPPPQSEPASPEPVQGEIPIPSFAGTLFGQLEEFQQPSPTLPTAQPQAVGTTGRRPPAQAMVHRYPRRTGLPVPDRLRTERMPRNTAVLMEALLRQVRFTPQQLLAAQRASTSVDRLDTDLFDPSQRQRVQEQAVISDLFARQNAHEVLRVCQHLDPADLGRQLQQKLADAMTDAGLPGMEERELRRALNLVLVQSPDMLRDALRRAMGACAEVIDAADLPLELTSGEPLMPSTRNLFGCMPDKLNTWEQAFADWLDRQHEVLWWLRNPARPNAADDWGVRIVLPETGRGYYPDFVVCVDGRKQRDGIALAETKERIETDDSIAKSRTEHKEYGRALMLTYDMRADRFIRVEYAPDLGRNREIGPLAPGDLVSN